MGRYVTLKWYRGEIIRKKLEALPDAIMAEVRKALAQSGDLVVERAKSLVPVDEGVLRDSIRWEFVKSTDAKFQAAIIIGPSGEFLKARGHIPNQARWVEFGTAAQTKGEKVARIGKRGKVRVRRSRGTTSGQPPRPYLLPAMRQMRKQVRKILGDAVNKALKQVAR